jgi:hypothetical protein
MPGERFQDMFARAACAFADDIAHAQRLYDAMSRLWFMPATPVLSNGGTSRGLPLSCLRNAVPFAYALSRPGTKMFGSPQPVDRYLQSQVRSIGEFKGRQTQA